MKLTAVIIMPPPAITHGSTPSPKKTAPSATDQTSCRKVIGCVTVSGAAAKASVIV